MFNQDPPVLADVLASHQRFRAEDPAVTFGDRTWSWSEIGARADRVANLLKVLDVQPGDCVALLSLNCIEAFEIFLGCLKRGAAVTPISFLLTPEQIDGILQDCRPKVLFAGAFLDHLIAESDLVKTLAQAGRLIGVGSQSPGAAAYQSLMDDQPARYTVGEIAPLARCNIIYSSGTTGAPKGIVHSQQARFTFALGLAAEYGVSRNSVVLVTTPLFTNGTWMLLLPALQMGAHCVLASHFEPHTFLDLSARHHVTHAFVVPTQLNVLLDHLGDAPAPGLDYALLLSSGSAAPAGLKRRVTDVFGPCLGETYGLTEGVGTFAPPDDVMHHPETVGRPITGTELVTITEDGQRAPAGEIGEIAGRSPAMMVGYHQREADTQALAWRDPETGHRFMRTGDIGRLDASGRLSILDRKKDMIVTGGLNIFAADIEAAFHALPEVTDVAVVAKPDPKWGETPYAFVRVSEGGPSIEALLEHANATLAKTQRVRHGEILSEDFPRNALGKVLKRELRDRIS